MAVLDHDLDIYHDTKGDWVVQLLHQSCRDFLGNQQSAGPLHVVIEAAETNVKSSVVRYLNAVLPTSWTLYAPSASPFERDGNGKIVAVVRYLQQHPLLEFVFSIISAGSLPSSNVIDSLLRGSSGAWILGFLAYPMKLSQACPEKYIDAACTLGFDNAVRAILASLLFNTQVWDTTKYPTLQRLLSTAMTFGLRSVVSDNSGLYLSLMVKLSLLSILPLIEQAAEMGHSLVLNALFRSLLGDYETISDIGLVNRERQSWLVDAERARVLRSEVDRKPTFLVIIPALSDSFQEIEKLVVKRCIRLVLNFADGKMIGDGELRPHLPIFEWDNFNEEYRLTDQRKVLSATKSRAIVHPELPKTTSGGQSNRPPSFLLEPLFLEEQVRFCQPHACISPKSWDSSSGITSRSCSALYKKKFQKTWEMISTVKQKGAPYVIRESIRIRR